MVVYVALYSILMMSTLIKGWGNTGHSKLVLAVHAQDRQMKQSVTISRLTHASTPYESSLDKESNSDFLQNIEEGDTIGLWAVSAPYPGDCTVYS
jgi:hypothetical protein